MIPAHLPSWCAWLGFAVPAAIISWWATDLAAAMIRGYGRHHRRHKGEPRPSRRGGVRTGAHGPRSDHLSRSR